MAEKDLWVFIETNEDGTPKNVGLELLNPGKELANAQGGKLAAIVIAKDPAPAVKQLSRYDVDEILVACGEEYEQYSTDAFTTALVKMAERYTPATLLIGATNNGRDLAPRVSNRLNTGLTADCTSLGYDEETKNILWTRPAFGGNLMAQIVCPDSRPQIGTVRPGIFKKPAEGDYPEKEPVFTDIHVDKNDIRTKIVEIIKSAGDTETDITAADVIVAAGRGAGNEKGLALCQKLADALGGTLAVSRPLVDNGLVSHGRQVGQTGKSVSPKLYIACGISGAIQHQVGMTGSDVIVAINKDPDAPVFGIATYGLVGDLYDVIPMLLDELKK